MEGRARRETICPDGQSGHYLPVLTCSKDNMRSLVGRNSPNGEENDTSAKSRMRSVTTTMLHHEVVLLL